MRDFLRWVIAHKEQTKRAARDRLQLALIKDRLDVAEGAGGTMDALRQEVLTVLSRYMVVEEDFQEFEIHRSEESVYLISNIQVKEVPRWAVVNS